MSKKLGEKKGPFIVWLFVTLCFAIFVLFRDPSIATLPQDVTISLILGLLINIAVPWGLVLVFLVIFWPFGKRRGL